jgi:hypothetical protein
MAQLRRCATCAFWAVVDGTALVGECHRLPPQITEANRDGDWPGTGATDWCGEWAQRAKLYEAPPRRTNAVDQKPE